MTLLDDVKPINDNKPRNKKAADEERVASNISVKESDRVMQ